MSNELPFDELHDTCNPKVEAGSTTQSSFPFENAVIFTGSSVRLLIYNVAESVMWTAKRSDSPIFLERMATETAKHRCLFSSVTRTVSSTSNCTSAHSSIPSTASQSFPVATRHAAFPISIEATLLGEIRFDEQPAT